MFILKRSGSKSKYTILRSRQFFRCWWGFFKGLEALFNFRAYFLWSRWQFFRYGVTFLDMVGLFKISPTFISSRFWCTFFSIPVVLFEIIIFLVKALFYSWSTQLFDRTISFLSIAPIFINLNPSTTPTPTSPKSHDNTFTLYQNKPPLPTPTLFTLYPSVIKQKYILI